MMEYELKMQQIREQNEDKLKQAKEREKEREKELQRRKKEVFLIFLISNLFIFINKIYMIL